MLVRHLLLGGAAIALVLAGSTSPGSAVAITDLAGNIPGVAWSGTSVSSRVGGPIFDRVWRLVLAEPRLVVINLNGVSGSQLGLYVFDDTASSVTTDTPIALSAKPGGSQALSLPLQPGTYFIDVNGRNPDRAYAFNLSLVSIPDRSPPFVSLEIADGRGSISNPDTTVTIKARDTLSGVKRMRVRIDGGVWGEWLPYEKVAAVSFRPTEGRHEVEVETENGLGLISDTVSESVNLDLTAPTAEQVSPVTTEVGSARPRIRFKFNEAMNTRSVVASGVTLVDLNGARISGVTTYDPTTRTAIFTPTSPLRAGETYIVQLNSPTDVAGNPAILLLPTELRYVVQTRITNMLEVEPVRYGASAQLRARVIGVSEGSLVAVEKLDGRVDPPMWEIIGEAAVRSGYVRSSVTPSATSRYRFRYLGDEGHSASTGSYVTIGVRPNLTIQGAGAIRTARRASNYTITGTTDPGEISITLIRFRCNDTFTACSRDGRVLLNSDEEGLVSYQWNVPSRIGNWRWVMRASTGETYAYSESPPLRIQVR